MNESDRWRMILGFAVLLIVGLLCGIIALGHVEEKTSYGLNTLIGALIVLAGGFAQWAFGSRKE